MSQNRSIDFKTRLNLRSARVNFAHFVETADVNRIHVRASSGSSRTLFKQGEVNTSLSEVNRYIETAHANNIVSPIALTLPPPPSVLRILQNASPALVQSEEPVIPPPPILVQPDPAPEAPPAPPPEIVVKK